MAPFTSGLTQALTRIPFGAGDFFLPNESTDLSHFWCHVVLLTALTWSSSGFSSQAPIIRIESWHGPSAAQPRVPLGWTEQSLGLIVFFFLFLSKVREIKFAGPQVYLGFSEVCIIIIFSNPLSSWLPHWWLPRSVNQLPLFYVVLLQLLISECMASTLQLTVLHLPRKASSSLGHGFRSCWRLSLGGLKPFPWGSGLPHSGNQGFWSKMQ